MSNVGALIPVNAELDIDLQALAVESGSPFRGTVVVRAGEPLEVEKVAVLAKVTEAWEEDLWEKDSTGNLHASLRRRVEPLYSGSDEVSAGFLLRAGESRSFPFEISVPKFQPSRVGGAVSYDIGASLAVKGRHELTKHVSALVVPGPISKAAIFRGITMTRVVPKEVVAVPCDGCGALVSLTAGVDRCPKCGRPLRTG